MHARKRTSEDDDEESMLSSAAQSDEIDYSLLPSQSSLVRERHDSNFDPITQYYTTSHPKHPKHAVPAANRRSVTDSVSKSQHERKLRAKVRGLDPDKVHPLSLFLFTWLNPFVSLGKHYNMTADDLPELEYKGTNAYCVPRFYKGWLESVQKLQKEQRNRFYPPLPLNSPDTPPPKAEPAVGFDRTRSILDTNTVIMENESKITVPPAVKKHLYSWMHYKKLNTALKPKPVLRPTIVDPVTGLALLDNEALEQHPAVLALESITTIPPTSSSSSPSSSPSTRTSPTPSKPDRNKGSNAPSNSSSPSINPKGEPFSVNTLSKYENRAQIAKEPKPFLFTELFRAFLTPFFLAMIGDAMFYATTLSQPYMIKRISYWFKDFRTNPDSVTTSTGLLWASALAAITMLSNVIHAFRNHQQLNIAIRHSSVMLVSIFEKVLRIAPYSIHNDKALSSGALMNFITQDVNQAFSIGVFINFVWSAPLAILICIYLMYLDIGAASWVCVIMMLLLIPYQILIAQVVRSYRIATMKLTDGRIKFVSQLLSGIRVIKAYAWEKVLAEELEVFRNKELSMQRTFTFFVWLSEIVTFIYPLLVTFATVAVYVYIEVENFSPETVFLILAYLNTIRFPIQFLSQAIQSVIDYHVSTTRIGRFLSKEEALCSERDIDILVQKYKEMRDHEEAMQKLQNEHNSQNLHDLPQIPHNTAINNTHSRVKSPSSTFAAPVSTSIHNNNETTASPSSPSSSSPGHVAVSIGVNGNASANRRGRIHGGVSHNVNNNIATKIIATQPSLSSRNSRTSPSQTSRNPSSSNLPSNLSSISTSSRISAKLLQNAPKSTVSVRHCDFYWSSFEQKPLQTPVLTDITFDVNCGHILAVVGPAARGKTALLTGLLKELYPQPHKRFSGLFAVPNIPKPQTISHDQSCTYFSFNNTLEIIPTDLINLNGLVGYAAQHPWLFNDTLRANIIMDLPFDKEKFEHVIDASCLGPDLHILTDGEATIISAGGVNLSGGQQARLQFARILYHVDVIDIVVLDDIWAACDAIVAKTMFKKGVQGILRDKAVILSLNSHYDILHDCHQIIMVDKCDDPFWPTLYSQLMTKQEAHLENLRLVQEQLILALSKDSDAIINNTTTVQQRPKTQQYTQLVEPEPQPEPQRSDCGQQRPTLSRTSTTNAYSQFGSDAIMSGFREPSTIVFKGNLQELLQFDHPLVHSLSFLSQHHEHEEDEFLNTSGARGLEDKQEHHMLTQEDENNTKLAKLAVRADDKALAAANKKLEQKIEGGNSAGSASPTQAQLPNFLYLWYIRGSHTNLGLTVLLALIIITSIVSQVFRAFTDLWFVRWADDLALPEPQHSYQYWIISSCLGMLIALIAFIAQVMVFLYILTDSARFVHKLTVQRLFHSTLAYLDTTPMGTLLNNLSKDVSTVDQVLPLNFVFMIQQALQLLTVILISFTSSPLFVLPLIPLTCWLLYLRAGYHRTSVQLKRIESSIIQPLYGLFSSVIKGSTVIRAFHLENAFALRIRKLIDETLRVKMVSTLLERRFAFFLNILSNIYIFLLAVCVVLLRNHLDTTLGMLAITYSLRLVGTLQICIRFQTQTTASMTSVHRLYNLQSIPQEPSFSSDNYARDQIARLQPPEFKRLMQYEEKKHFAANSPRYTLAPDNKTKIDLHYRYHQQQTLKYWPWFGKIEFRNVSMRYRPELPVVLHNLSVTILPGLTVGVVGRSGAGKSSTLLALTRAVNLEKGDIYIDDVSIKDVGLGDLRERISLIPQSPTIFSGTVRSNLDPLARCTDEELWIALELTSLDDKIRQLENGLYSAVQENGSNFSSSERQLLCISRALLCQPDLRRRKVTSSQHDGTVVDNHVHYDAQYESAQQQKMLADSTSSNTSSQPQQQQQQSSKLNQSKGIGHYASVPPTLNQTTPQFPTQGSILLADEMTSHTSILEDQIIQHTIRTAFSTSTILVIAHRLDTVVDLDRIMTLQPITQDLLDADGSSLVEYDVPYLLLNNPKSTFYQICLSTGVDNFIKLYMKAKESFLATKQKDLLKFGNVIHDPMIPYNDLPQPLVRLLLNQGESEIHQVPLTPRKEHIGQTSLDEIRIDPFLDPIRTVEESLLSPDPFSAETFREQAHKQQQSQ